MFLAPERYVLPRMRPSGDWTVVSSLRFIEFSRKSEVRRESRNDGKFKVLDATNYAEKILANRGGSGYRIMTSQSSQPLGVTGHVVTLVQ